MKLDVILNSKQANDEVATIIFKKCMSALHCNIFKTSTWTYFPEAISTKAEYSDGSFVDRTYYVFYSVDEEVYIEFNTISTHLLDNDPFLKVDKITFQGNLDELYTLVDKSVVDYIFDF